MKIILQRLMDAAGDNAYDIQRKTGIQPPTIYRYFANDKGTLSAGTVEKLARCYGITPSQLRGDMPIEGMEIPVEQPELKDLLTLDEFQHVTHLKNLPRESRAILFRLTEILALAEEQAPYKIEIIERRNTNRYPNMQLRAGETYQNSPVKRRLKDQNGRKIPHFRPAAAPKTA